MSVHSFFVHAKKCHIIVAIIIIVLLTKFSFDNYK